MLGLFAMDVSMVVLLVFASVLTIAVILFIATLAVLVISHHLRLIHRLERKNTSKRIRRQIFRRLKAIRKIRKGRIKKEALHMKRNQPR